MPCKDGWPWGKAAGPGNGKRGPRGRAGGGAEPKPHAHGALPASARAGTRAKGSPGSGLALRRPRPHITAGRRLGHSELLRDTEHPGGTGTARLVMALRGASLSPQERKGAPRNARLRLSLRSNSTSTKTPLPPPPASASVQRRASPSEPEIRARDDKGHLGHATGGEGELSQDLPPPHFASWTCQAGGRGRTSLGSSQSPSLPRHVRE